MKGFQSGLKDYITHELLFHFRKGNDDSIWSLGRKIWSNVFIKINCPPNGQDIFSTCPVLEI